MNNENSLFFQLQLEYRTPSPDELALADCALQNRFKFIHRTQQRLTVDENGIEKTRTYTSTQLHTVWKIYTAHAHALTRTRTHMFELFVLAGTEVQYELLATLHFTSARRRMAVIVRTPEVRALSKNGNSYFYTPI